MYILEFANGERYVGLSSNVVTRFATHRRTFDDIEAVRFCPEPTADLPTLEVQIIHQQQQQGHVLRNVRCAMGPTGPSSLDVVVTHQQDGWLAGGDDVLDADLGDGERRVSDHDRLRAQPAFERMQASTNAPLATELVAAYVDGVLPRPRETEGRFWSLSAAPSTGASHTWRRLAVVSVHSMETFVVGETLMAGRDDDWITRGFLVLSRGTLEATTGSTIAEIAATFPALGFSHHLYEAAGGDDVAVHWTGTVDAVLSLDELPWERASGVLERISRPVNRHH